MLYPGMENPTALSYRMNYVLSGSNVINAARIRFLCGDKEKGGILL